MSRRDDNGAWPSELSRYHCAQREQEFQAFLMYLRESRGFDFTVYQHARLRRQLEKRLQALHFERILDYWQYLEAHPDEFIRLLHGLLIQATAFFRDMAAWTYLSEQIIPQLAAATGAASSLRIWNAGCASGEETYTLAMVLAEALGLATFQRRVRIFATDIDERALERGRQGNYSATTLRSVPARLKETYFQPVGGRYVVRSDIRHNIIFGRHDLTHDPPLAHLDLLVCRNTLMFFSIEAQHRLLRRFSFALQNEGILFLGKAETPLFQGRIFILIHPQHRVFMKMPNAGYPAPRPQSEVEFEPASQSAECVPLHATTNAQKLQEREEELETINEELQAANEELETTSEELQATNEELQTLNEELQMSNASLQQLNEDYQKQHEAFTQLLAFTKSVLASLPSHD